MKARDVMTREVVSVGPETLVRDVAATMLARRVSGLPVVSADRRVLGVVSEGDLIRRPEIGTTPQRRRWLSLFVSDDQGARDFVKSHGLRAREVMTSPAICVSPDMHLAEVVALMQKSGVKRLPVVADGGLTGIVSRADLVRAFVLQPPAAPVTPDDQALRDRIEAMLRNEEWATSAVLTVQVETGIAQLWGTVTSEAQREALMLAVRGVPGVRDVESHLTRQMPG